MHAARSPIARPSKDSSEDYELGSIIGRGASGTVYRAVHTPSGQTVAIKVLGVHGSQESRARFRREALLMARLSERTPRICRVIDFGVAKGGQAYTVMELLEGESLSARLKRCELTLIEALAVIRQIGEALAVAHGEGVVHRDLKPSNVFVLSSRRDPEPLSVKLLDFGVAKPLGNDDELQTSAGFMIGTPAYMSPEQFSEAANVDHRADLWSLAALAHRVLVGRPPFGFGTVTELAMRSSHADLPSVAAARPHLPPAVDDWFARALAKAPEDRFSTVEEMVSALESIVLRSSGPRPIAVPPHSTTRLVEDHEARQEDDAETLVCESPSVEDESRFEATVVREVSAELLAQTATPTHDAVGRLYSGERATLPRRNPALRNMPTQLSTRRAEEEARAATTIPPAVWILLAAIWIGLIAAAIAARL
jgi:serine/threonine protein kinase